MCKYIFSYVASDTHANAGIFHSSPALGRDSRVLHGCISFKRSATTTYLFTLLNNSCTCCSESGKDEGVDTGGLGGVSAYPDLETLCCRSIYRIIIYLIDTKSCVLIQCCTTLHALSPRYYSLCNPLWRL